MREERVLLHLDERTRRAIDPGDVYFLEADGRDREVRLEPPVNRVLPIACGELPALWRAFGEPRPLRRARSGDRERTS